MRGKPNSPNLCVWSITSAWSTTYSQSTTYSLITYSPVSLCSGEERVTLTYRSCGERLIPTYWAQSAALTPALFLKHSQRKAVALCANAAGNEAKEHDTEAIWEWMQQSFWLSCSPSLWIRRWTQRKLMVCSMLCLSKGCAPLVPAHRVHVSLCFSFLISVIFLSLSSLWDDVSRRYIL